MKTDVSRILSTAVIMLFTFFCFCSVLLPARCVNAAELPLNEIKLPQGFEISVYANVPNARSMTLSPKGTLFVGTTKEGKIYAIPSQNTDSGAKKVVTIGQALSMPNGVAFRNGALYVAEINRVLRYDDIESHLSNPPKPAIVYDKFPRDRSHGWKFIGFGPDGMLYVPVGAPCNICEPDGNRYALITRMKTDGGAPEIFARGVRNTVGFDWHPATKELWFTDNGRDRMGDDVPPDELNHAPKKGLDFGYPYCHGGDIPDPEYGRKHSCNELSLRLKSWLRM